MMHFPYDSSVVFVSGLMDVVWAHK